MEARSSLGDLTGTTTADGRYRFDAYAGSGSYGIVYRGWDLRLDHEVAIKVYDHEGEDIELDEVLNEARIQRLCAHENIVDIFNLEIAPPTPIMVMEYLPEGSAEARIGQHGAPYAEAVRWAREALDGLAHAHGLGVLHRDIKPGNVMIGPGGQAKLSDFGLAEDTVRNRIASPAVYLPHAAPELFAGAPSSVQSDVWAMGATLYRLVTGAHAFSGEMTPILRGEYVPPQKLNPQVPRCLTQIIAKAFHPDPGARFASATAMLAELTRCRAMASWHRMHDTEAIEAWAADLRGGRATLRILERRGRFDLEAKLDRGKRPRRVRSDQPFASPAQARNAMATLMRQTVQTGRLRR
jgi:eukaryotic-like serine/threonine-protein kinase